MIKNLQEIIENIEQAFHPLQGGLIPIDIRSILETKSTNRDTRRAELVQSLDVHKSQGAEVSRVLRGVQDIIGAFESKMNRRQHELEIALAPVSALPSEVLCLIFMFGREQARDEGTFLRNITHVSSRWRNIAIEYSPLWNHIHLNRHSLEESIDAQLKRAKLGPLQLSFTRRAITEPGWRKEYVLERYSTRWTKMEIIGTAAITLFDLILGMPGISFPALTSLFLLGESGGTLLLNGLGQLPTLRKLHLADIVLYGKHPLPSTLRSLTIIRCESRGPFWADLPLRCLSLESLKVEDVTFLGGYNTASPITLENLRKLTIRHMAVNSVMPDDLVIESKQWFDFFTNKVLTPNLQSINAMFRSSPRSWKNLTQIVKAQSQITHITIGGDSHPLRQFIFDLVNDACCAEDHVLPPSVAPRLRDLTIVFDRQFMVPPHDLKDFQVLLTRLIATRAKFPLSYLRVTRAWIEDAAALANLGPHLDILNGTESETVFGLDV